MTSMTPCPRCGYPEKDTRAQAGGRAGGAAKVKKGFAVAGQPSDAARKKAWQTRKARAQQIPNAEAHGSARSAAEEIP